MAAGPIKGITITFPEEREDFFKEIKSLDFVEDLKPHGEFGFYIKVKNPVINYRLQYNGVLVPSVVDFNKKEKEHYDGAIIAIPITRKYFHDLLEIMPIILTLKENNEKFKVIFNSKEMVNSDKIFNSFLTESKSYIKDVTPEPLKYWTDFLEYYKIDYECIDSKFNRVMSADSCYIFYYTDVGFEKENGEFKSDHHHSNNTGLAGVAKSKLLSQRHPSLDFKLSYQIVPFMFPTLLMYSDSFEILKRNFKQIVSKTIPGKKIFICRDTSKYPDRSIKNSDLLAKYMESKGFELFFNEDLNMIDQIREVTTAECIAGIVGSNFLNAMFCSPGSQNIIIYPDKSQDWLIYSNQAARWDIDSKNIYCDPYGEDIINYFETTNNQVIKRWVHNV